MGWNTGWTILQNTAIGVYDEIGPDEFTKIARVLISPFQETDIDEGGKDYDLRTKDGKSMEQIIVESMWTGFSPDKIALGDLDGDVYEGYDHADMSYIKAFYLIIESKKWADKKHTLILSEKETPLTARVVLDVVDGKLNSFDIHQRGKNVSTDMMTRQERLALQNAFHLALEAFDTYS